MNLIRRKKPSVNIKQIVKHGFNLHRYKSALFSSTLSIQALIVEVAKISLSIKNYNDKNNLNRLRKLYFLNGELLLERVKTRSLYVGKEIKHKQHKIYQSCHNCYPSFHARFLVKFLKT